MAALSLTKSRRWRVWIPGPDVNDVPVLASGPAAWVKAGHLFIGVFETQQWTKAWAPGGWLSVELMEGPD